MASYETERAVVERFLAIFGVTEPRLANPNAGLVNDSGADVVWTVDGGDIGFQVTEYHSDRGAAPKQKGSDLRRAEKAKAASGRPYTMAVKLDPIPAIASAVSDKVDRAIHANHKRFRGLILLIVSSIPHGGVAATPLLDMALEPYLPRLKAATHESLCRGPWARSVDLVRVTSRPPRPSA